MNILWICNDNTANIPYTIKNGINSLTDHNCKLIQSMLTQLRYPIDGTIIAHDITLKQFKSYIDKADVVHLNDSVVSGEYPPQKTLFFKDKKKVNVYSLLSGKKVFRHANGTYYRNDYKRVNILCDRYNITKTVSTPDLISLGKDNKWIPQPIDLDKYYFSDIKESKRISHAPTKDKGTDIIKAAIESIGYSPVVISGMSHDKCIELRRSCPFHIDQVSYLGIYGLSSIEAVAIGQINMATLHNVRGYIPNHPFIEINGLTKKAGINALTKAINCDRKKHLINARKWLFDIHSVKSVVDKLIELYEN